MNSGYSKSSDSATKSDVRSVDGSVVNGDGNNSVNGKEGGSRSYQKVGPNNGWNDCPSIDMLNNLKDNNSAKNSANGNPSRKNGNSRDRRKKHLNMLQQQYSELNPGQQSVASESFSRYHDRVNQYNYDKDNIKQNSEKVHQSINDYNNEHLNSSHNPLHNIIFTQPRPGQSIMTLPGIPLHHRQHNNRGSSSSGSLYRSRHMKEESTRDSSSSNVLGTMVGIGSFSTKYSKHSKHSDRK
ncbi:uncharacterized protein ASCRUDRAFT_129596 [Ascoidea rubescens DSM 1968]|uniref:Uncharacterized protein n=1 Tax=Ascoidea rubescens DSM 1968 TaxID=1344418 RepID=A0A1D2V8P9_9ASCO|nr:hypothetical protein ASCRUDRAFT_129596 [Ascoidea rubescens DSM 1968]ODV58081.1 hypothetical protein ASCRUDRAFT_129596 [Ascoidea rubescens DSM 1968]